jgi:MoxR-vWA-beta-propeller ternary system domain bpX2
VRSSPNRESVLNAASYSWAAFVKSNHSSRLASLRSHIEIELATTANETWLRGAELTPTLETKLAAIVDSPIFRIDQSNWLFTVDSKVPSNRLPKLEWQSISSFFSLSLPTSRYAEFRLPRIPLELRRSGPEVDANVLVTSWESFRTWAESAPHVRLASLLFAVSHSADLRNTEISSSANEGDGPLTVVLGNSLPPILGERFYLRGRIAVPLGYSWEPQIDTQSVEQLIRRVVSLPDGYWNDVGVCVWLLSGKIEIVAKGELVMALRQHIRATADSLMSQR